MDVLFRRLEAEVDAWRANGYTASQDTIAEVLEYASGPNPETRYLRDAQLRALECYWYLRAVLGTPHVLDLYRRFWPEDSDKTGLLDALGAKLAFEAANYDLAELWKRIRADDEFVKRFGLESLRETLTLAYPSYILALAMGAGKTVLIGAIIATEFALAHEHPDGDYAENALVFAPGTTVIPSLRELTTVPYERILPPRLFKIFAASLKLTFTRDGDPGIPVTPGSSFNVIVTNTEKIRIQARSIPKGALGHLFPGADVDRLKEVVANRRLRDIANLPKLAVFSDEAHNTYGQSLRTGLKRVRETVDFLGQETSLQVVVNTTGTPYFKRQSLKDVVTWYSLSEGIRDGVLKDVAGNIRAGEFDEASVGDYVEHIVTDFFSDYGGHSLPDGSPAKLAMYFPQTDDIEDLRPRIEAAATHMAISPAQILVNTSNSALTSKADRDAFERLNDPATPHRLILLVNKGTEGWNCPSLFGCALVRKLTSSNNFVLQAASRCLRQVPGNRRPARIYVSADNYGVLDRQLAETYGETLDELNRRPAERTTRRLVVRKPDAAPIVVMVPEREIVPRDAASGAVRFRRPGTAVGRGIIERGYSLAARATGRRVLTQTAADIEIHSQPAEISTYAAAVDLAAQYRLNPLDTHRELRRVYEATVPVTDLPHLSDQIEEQCRAYEEREVAKQRALALVKPGGFERSVAEDGSVVLSTDVSFAAGSDQLITALSDVNNPVAAEIGFHYDPYNFDSKPERAFYEWILDELRLNRRQVEAVYFSGGITDPAKTDLLVRYRNERGGWSDYTPDFVVRVKALEGAGRPVDTAILVEVKREANRNHPVEGEMGTKAEAVRALVDLDPTRLAYEILFAPSDTVPYTELLKVKLLLGDAERPVQSMPRFNPAELDAFCQRWHVRELALFGSAVRGALTPVSDIDVLVSFEEGAHWGWRLVEAEEELEAIFGRPVDLVTRDGVEASRNEARRQSILGEARAIYERQG